MSVSLVQARIDSELKAKVEKDLKSFGLDSSTVIRMLYSKIAQIHAIPFTIGNVSLNGDEFETDQEYFSQIPGFTDKLQKSYDEPLDKCASIEEAGW